MNFTKSIPVAVIYGVSLLFPAIVVANTDPATFQADKERHIANILRSIQIDQKNLSCVQAAQDHQALNACQEITKQDMSALEPKAAEVINKKTENTANTDVKQQRSK